MSIIVRAALLGFATGGRSTLGLAALAVSAKDTGSALTNPWVGRAATTAAAGELIGDKLPQTPSRLEPQGAVPRLALGAGCGAILAHRAGSNRVTTALAAAAGLAGATAGTWLGAGWRGKATAKLGDDLYGAFVEDAICLAAARYAVA